MAKIKAKPTTTKANLFLKNISVKQLNTYKSKAKELGYTYNEFFEEMVKAYLGGTRVRIKKSSKPGSRKVTKKA